MPIVEMDVWDEVMWRWNFEWRWPLFEQENQKLNQMNQILLECAFNSDKEDRACKKFDKSENYFVKSFLIQVFGAFAPSTTATSCIGGVWIGLVCQG